ncbi:AraC family transcriptional regulator ligand-binding domain-containing protein [Gilvimarinus sp. F26214L]|uniref:AraC family transcriptional regulator ligand-binding domain-containing protein n=1 Tax=Gilvimarinus sp. DZF01 TaxID=3461371 RepID=UPI004045E697
MEAKTIPFELHPLGFIEAFTHFGADLDRLLDNTGITRDMLTSREARISYRQQHQLLRNGIRLCRKPGLGLLVGQYMDWSYNGTVGGVVHCSPTLQAAGEAFRRYVLIAQPYYTMYIHKPNMYIDADGMVVTPLRYFASPENDAELNLFEIEYRLAVTLRICDLCGNKSVPDPAVHAYLHYPAPAHAEMYQDLPCDEVRFDCEQSAIAAHHLFITEPFRLFRKSAFDRIIAQCEEEFQKAELESSTTRKVRWHICAYFNGVPGRLITLEEVAELLATTPRALTRKLAAEGTSFRSILHEVRMEVASHHLRSSTLSVDRIAELMGFSNPSSLRRAIKNWSGHSVGELREKRRGVVEH